jgi:hypothetical protein
VSDILEFLFKSLEDRNGCLSIVYPVRPQIPSLLVSKTLCWLKLLEHGMGVFSRGLEKKILCMPIIQVVFSLLIILGGLFLTACGLWIDSIFP